MAAERTTEELFEGLTPQAREEAVSLASRLQEQDAETSHVLAAAREAGIEDRYLREAISRLGKPATESSSRFAVVPAAIVGILFLFAQGYAGTVTFQGIAAANLWIPMFLAAALGAVLPRNRNRWLAPLVVLGTWLAVTAFYSVISSDAVSNISEAQTYAYRIAIFEAALAFFGALIVNWISELSAKQTLSRRSS